MNLMRHICLVFGLCIFAQILLAHPMPNTLIALKITPERLLFDIKTPVTELETAVFQTSDSISEGLRALPIFAILEQYFLKHLKIKGTDGVLWQCQLIALDTIEGADPFIGKFSEIHIGLQAIPPKGADIREFFLHYDAIIHQIVTHQAILSVQQDWDNGIHIEEGDTSSQVLAVIQVEQSTNEILPVAVKLGKGSVWRGFIAMFRLGIRHIAEGYDHLLFLLVLLLPAPLLEAKRRWTDFGGWRYSFLRLLRIVTAFTIGHSLTLAIGAVGWLRIPTQPVEVVIALSILVSAIHAMRPIFSGREGWIAAGFGLVHGLAFASILANLDLDRSRLIWSILGFNLGIEAMQLAVVGVVLPVFIVLSQTRYYAGFRVAGAVIAAILSLIWAVERVVF
jgi:HupE / UreJ protein